MVLQLHQKKMRLKPQFRNLEMVLQLHQKKMRLKPQFREKGEKCLLFKIFIMPTWLVEKINGIPLIS
jgi:hypothetical protein